MKKVIIDDEKSAVEYLEMVLNEWDSWRDHHICLVKALQILLKINKSKNQDTLTEIFKKIESKSHITFINGNEDNPMMLVDYEFYNELKANIQREKDNEY